MNYYTKQHMLRVKERVTSDWIFVRHWPDCAFPHASLLRTCSHGGNARALVMTGSFMRRECQRDAKWTGWTWLKQQFEFKSIEHVHYQLKKSMTTDDNQWSTTLWQQCLTIANVINMHITETTTHLHLYNHDTNTLSRYHKDMWNPHGPFRQQHLSNCQRQRSHTIAPRRPL